MDITKLKQLNEQLVEMSTTVTEAIDEIEERGKLRHREYSEIRNSAQEIKKIVQLLRVEVLEQFKKQKDNT